MLDLLLRNPGSLSPAARRLSLLGTRFACIIAPLLLLGFLGAAAAHFFFEVGNYPDARSRRLVGALFLSLFSPFAAAIWHLARLRRKQLAAPSSASAQNRE